MMQFEWLEADPVLTTLKNVILRGWPDEKKDFPIFAHRYFTLRDELAIHDGLVLRG